MMRPGFRDPVPEAQGCFRAMLDAMSRPGRVHTLDVALDAPSPLTPATAAVLLTLADAETSLHLMPDGGAAADWVRFHCGSAPAALSEAGFVLSLGTHPPLSALLQGSEEAPEQGATLICQVRSLTEGKGWRLAGPGIRDFHHLRVEGLAEDFLQQWAAQRSAFPRGVDIILCTGRQLAALPRTVTIEEG
jgi:alpha-D-ribose 1-methylphosphonate 5-triphosphate synthase subunit PhnH